MHTVCTVVLRASDELRFEKLWVNQSQRIRLATDFGLTCVKTQDSQGKKRTEEKQKTGKCQGTDGNNIVAGC